MRGVVMTVRAESEWLVRLIDRGIGGLMVPVGLGRGEGKEEMGRGELELW